MANTMRYKEGLTHLTSVHAVLERLEKRQAVLDDVNDEFLACLKDQ